VLLPSDTYRKIITLVTAVSFPSAKYLLTFPRISSHEMREVDSQASGVSCQVSLSSVHYLVSYNFDESSQ
jgi:hypothetical protein